MCSKKALQGITFDFKMQDFFEKIYLISQFFFQISGQFLANMVGRS